jgi:hypothetical protein
MRKPNQRTRSDRVAGGARPRPFEAHPELYAEFSNSGRFSILLIGQTVGEVPFSVL